MTAWRVGGAGSIGGGCGSAGRVDEAGVGGGCGVEPGVRLGAAGGRRISGCGNRGPDMEIPAEGVGGSGKWLYPGKTAGRVTSPGHGVDRANDPTRQKMQGA